MEEEWKVANSRKILNQKPKTNVRIKSNTSKSNSIPVNKEIKEKNLASNEKKKSQATTAATTPKTKKIPTKNIELFDLIEAQLNVPTKKNKNSSTKSNNTTLHEPTNPIDKKNSTLLERVKILKIDNQSTNEFIVVKKKRKKKLSTLKKRILLVFDLFYLRNHLLRNDYDVMHKILNIMKIKFLVNLLVLKKERLLSVIISLQPH